MIIRRGQTQPDYLRNSNGHEPLVRKLELRDDKPAMLRNFIRIECLPLGALDSVKPKDWEVRVDETGDLPAWFEERFGDWEEKCLKTLTKIIIPRWVKNGLDGGLDLGGCTSLTSLGNLKSVGEWLDLRGCTNLTSLGNLKSVGGWLDLRGCANLTSLGNLKSVGEWLDLGGCANLTSFGRVRVGVRLYAYKTKTSTGRWLAE